MALPSTLANITQKHLDDLVADAAREGQHMDFKRDYPAAWDNATKHEFLADVTAFANAGGGDLIYGIDEGSDAQAIAVVPQVLPSSADQEIRRLQDFLLNLVEPRVPGCQIHAAEVSVTGTAGNVIVVRVPQSWAGPHRVRTNQHFFIRDGLRKRQLDVPEIRSLFMRSETQAQRVRDFRTDRLGKIMAGEAPHRLVDGPLLVVHLVPTQAAQGLVQIDPTVYATQRGLPLIGTSSSQARLNIDGALAVRNPNQHGRTQGYGQFFRNGFFESTYVVVHSVDPGSQRVILPSLKYEQFLIDLFKNFRNELTLLGIDTECAVLLSLLQADKVKLGVSSSIYLDFDSHLALFDRSTVVVPDILALSDLEPDQAMKPAFDLMWQAAGFIGSRNYNEAGAWAPPQT